MDKRIVPLIVGIMVVLIVGLGILIYLSLRPESGSRTESEGFSTFEGAAVDSAARIEIERLRSTIEGLNQQIERLDQRLGGLEMAAIGQSAEAPESITRDGPNQILDSYAQVVEIAARRDINQGVTIASPSFLVSVFGNPRETLSDDCEPMTNTRLASKLEVAEVGPIRVRMLRPAIDSLGRVFENIRATDPDLYERINTAGSLCVRQIRGTTGRVSTHSFGLSVDLNIDGKLDTLGDGQTQLGLTILADFFRNEGWYWGAGFSREDSMHFEVGRELVEEWVRQGLL